MCRFGGADAFCNAEKGGDVRWHGAKLQMNPSQAAKVVRKQELSWRATVMLMSFGRGLWKTRTTWVIRFVAEARRKATTEGTRLGMLDVLATSIKAVE
jgi:hypothetical protein